MKQTAVEWYENEINALFGKYENKEISESEFLIMKHNLFYPAKEMEKEQMLKTFAESRVISVECAVWNCEGDRRKWESFEHYYNETFNTKEK
jgi:hypothetical protein